VPPKCRSTISAAIDTAVCSGVRAPRSSPIGTLDGEGTSSISYLEVIEVTDIDEYRAAGKAAEFVALLTEWATYVELDEAVHGPVVD
jgi:hypothetical protein